MSDFKSRGGAPKRFGSAGGKPSFHKKGGNNWADKRGGDRSTTLYKARCSKCGKECEVPFRPVNGKPVFCRNCFVKPADTDTRGRAGDRFPKREFGASSAPRFEAPKSDGAVLKQLEILNSKIDRLVNLMEGMKTTTPAVKEGQTEAVEAEVKVKKVAKKKKATK